MRWSLRTKECLPGAGNPLPGRDRQGWTEPNKAAACGLRSRTLMKKINTFLSLLLAAATAHGQCEFVDVNVSASDTSFIQLYHPGFFNLESGFANICAWEITTFDGTLVHEAITSGTAQEQGFMLFEHDVPITDLMQVVLVITNDVTGSTCTITDTLFWEETEVLPGAIIGNWAILGSNGGISTGLADEASGNAQLLMYPTLATDHVQLQGDAGRYALTIVSMGGELEMTHSTVRPGERVDVAGLVPGAYLVQLMDERGVPLGVRKFIKL